MPAPKNVKKPTDHRGKVEGRVFTWSSEDGVTIEIPLKIKMKVLRAVGSGDLDAVGMFAMLEAVMPGQSELLDELDVLEFQAMFTAWQDAYNASNGASLGELSSSPTS